MGIGKVEKGRWNRLSSAMELSKGKIVSGRSLLGLIEHYGLDLRQKLPTFRSALHSFPNLTPVGPALALWWKILSCLELWWLFKLATTIVIFRLPKTGLLSLVLAEA